MRKSIEICQKQLLDASTQNSGLFRTIPLEEWVGVVRLACGKPLAPCEKSEWLQRFQHFLADGPSTESDNPDEESFIIRLMEWCITRMQHAWYIKTYGCTFCSDAPPPIPSRFNRPTLPISTILSLMKTPKLPFILPFHTVSNSVNARCSPILCTVHHTIDGSDDKVNCASERYQCILYCHNPYRQNCDPKPTPTTTTPW